MATEMYNFEPDFLVAPGETLLETIEELELSQSDLAKRTGRPLKTINGIIKGNIAITPETALQFEKVLGVPSRFWLNLESNYRDLVAKQQERERLRQKVEWIKKFPIKKMIKMEWISFHNDPTEQLKVLFSFFGVASIESWEEIWDENIAFRKSEAFKSDLGAIAAWIRKAEIEAQKIECRPFDKDLLKSNIVKMRKLTTESDPNVFIPELTKLCSEAGIALVFIPELEGCRASGVTKWIGHNKALIALSLRYKSNDHLWFTFFHEIGHILLHGKKLTFVEGIVSDEQKQKEDEANAFSSNILIPKDKLKELIQSGTISRLKVLKFSEEIGIAPGIVVGRLQHAGIIPYKNLNGLKQYYTWK